MSKHTYAQGVIAHRGNGGFAIIPDAVINDQKGWSASRKSFQAIPCTNTGRRTGAAGFSAVLRGDLYGLGTAGTSDPEIRNA